MTSYFHNDTMFNILKLLSSLAPYSGSGFDFYQNLMKLFLNYNFFSNFYISL